MVFFLKKSSIMAYIRFVVSQRFDITMVSSKKNKSSNCETHLFSPRLSTLIPLKDFPIQLLDSPLVTLIC